MAPPDQLSSPPRVRRPSRTREAARSRRLDASMTLLVEVMQHPLDPGYAAAARERGGGARRMGPVAAAVTVLVAVVCGWVTTASVMELRRPQPEAIRARAALESEIQRRTAEVDRLQKSNEALRASIAAAQQKALAGDGSATLLAQSRNLALTTGEVAVTGPGLELSLDDAPGSGGQTSGVDPRQTGSAEQGRVVDRDVQIVVNGLWAAGAEAIAVNGERLTALSAIRTAGQAILVNFRPLTPPYVIDAIGNPKALQSGFGEDMAGEYVKSLSNNYGIRVTMTAKTSLTLPGASSLTLRYTGATSGAALPTGTPKSAPAVASSSTPTARPTRHRTPTTTPGTAATAPAGSGHGTGRTATPAPSASVSPSTATPGSGSAATTQEVSP